MIDPIQLPYSLSEKYVQKEMAATTSLIENCLLC